MHSIKYERIKVKNLDKQIDDIYLKLLNEKKDFMIIDDNNKLSVLTKEKSVIPISSEDEFINFYNKQKYYKTNIINKNIKINEDDLKVYYSYLDKYGKKMSNTIYANKYLFGSIAVKTDKGFITTLRGKEDLNDYTIVESVNHDECIVNVIDKKASLNAPLLDYIFKNDLVKVIVHIHEYDDNLPYYDYYFPGTKEDSIRDNKKSFNIRYHGLFYLFDEKGKLI